MGKISKQTAKKKDTQMANKYTKRYCREFPGGPVVRTQDIQCRAHGFNLWSGTKILYAMAHGQISKFFKKGTRCHVIRKMLIKTRKYHYTLEWKKSKILTLTNAGKYAK